MPPSFADTGTDSYLRHACAANVLQHMSLGSFTHATRRLRGCSLHHFFGITETCLFLAGTRAIMTDVLVPVMDCSNHAVAAAHSGPEADMCCFATNSAADPSTSQH
jgi:hypothetical protein